MNNFSETVRNSADIVKVISEYVSLKAAGSSFKGLCPFHSEKTPSFTVHRDKQFFHCFGCHKGGDVFSFVMEAERASFPEAVRIVADKCGIPIPTNPGLDDKKSEERKQLLETYEQASAYFHRMLNSEEAMAARQVLEKRQIGSAFAERFKLGYAPSTGLAAYLKLKDPIASGLFVRNDRGEVYERFRRRLMFPIWNERGKTIAFGGRALAADAQPKYLNSAESPLYTKSTVLYALHFARDAAQKAGRLVVVEGYFDCLSLHQAGIENVVASCGTSLTQQQVALMARYVPEIVMNYDPDSAGQNAMRRSLDLLLAKGLRVRILKLAGGLDPDDFVRKEGGDVYRRLLANAPWFWEYLIAEVSRQNDLSQPAMKANAVNDVMQYVVKLQDRVEQLEVARAVAEAFKIPETILVEQLKLTPRRPDILPAARVTAQMPASRKLDVSEKQLIQALLQNPRLGSELKPLLGRDFWANVWSNAVIENLVKDPNQNVETALESVQDDDLKREVRAAILEPVGAISEEQALASVKQLYVDHLVQKLKESSDQLRQYQSGSAPKELVERHMEMVREKTRVGASKA
jgi:DNA primase